MESKIKYMTPKQYADMKQLPVELVEQMMQPSRNTTMIFDTRDVDRTSPKNPRLVYRPRDAAGIEWPRQVRRKLVHVTGRGATMEIHPVEDAGVGGMTHPGAKDVNGDVPLGVKRRKGVTKRFNVKPSKSKSSLSR